MDSFYSFFKKVLLNEKGQEERGSYIYGFSGKNSHLKQASHYGPKNGPLNFGYTVRIFLKFYSMKGVKKYNGTYIVSLKKILIWGKWAILGLKMAHPHNFGSTLRIFFFFEVLHNEKGQEVYGTYIYGFSGKNSHLGQVDHFGWKITRLHNFASTLRIFFKFCITEGVGVHENYINGFSGK